MTKETSKETQEREAAHYANCEKFIKRVCDFYVNDIDNLKKWVIEKQPYRYCILNCYGAFVKSKEIVLFEKLEQSVKDEIIQISYEWVPRQDNEIDKLIPFRVALCCCIWTLNFALDKYYL